MYELIPNKKAPTVLSLDPGTANCAIACSTLTEQPVLLANALLRSPIRGLTSGLPQKRRAFLQELALWVKAYDPSIIIMERFQSRGLKGSTVEEISVMLGCVLTQYPKLDVQFITAATWKNQWHRDFSGYELKTLYKVCRTTPHQLDATLIGLHAGQKKLGYSPTYHPENLLQGVASVSLDPLYNRQRTLSDFYSCK